MKINLTNKNLLTTEKEEILSLLNREDKNIKTDLQQMWYLMDLIWDDYLCDNKNLNWTNISSFYSHPVWLLNGLFIEQDTASMAHRHIISDWIIEKAFNSVIDYGGGFGTLARLISDKNENILVDIYEPHPSQFGLKRVNEYKNITMIANLNSQYDCLLSTDVLEHVADPLNDLFLMVKSVKPDAYLVIANAFFPMIKCHLPKNFHFRYTFNIFAKMMGLEYIGTLQGTHAIIFKKTNIIKPNWNKIRRYEKISKIAFPIIRVLLPILRPAKRILFK